MSVTDVTYMFEQRGRFSKQVTLELSKCFHFYFQLSRYRKTWWAKSMRQKHFTSARATFTTVSGCIHRTCKGPDTSCRGGLCLAFTSKVYRWRKKLKPNYRDFRTISKMLTAYIGSICSLPWYGQKLRCRFWGLIPATSENLNTLGRNVTVNYGCKHVNQTVIRKRAELFISRT